MEFCKKNLFARVIVFIIAVSFIFTSIPSGAFAGAIDSDTLRTRASKGSSTQADIKRDLLKDGGNEDLSQRLVVRFTEIGKNDVEIAGGKGANLGELQKVKSVSVPAGVAVTTKAFRLHIDKGLVETEVSGKKTALTLREFIDHRLQGLDYNDSEALAQAGQDIRRAIIEAKMPQEVETEIQKWYMQLCDEAGTKDLPVAVRSSATAEDTADASFAGQQDTYLNMRGEEEVLYAVKRNWASLFTDRAIFYRHDQNIDHGTAYLSAVIQRMVESQTAGTAFSVHTDTGFPAISIDAAWGLGEGVVSGTASPDSFVVKKDVNGIFRMLRKNFGAKLQKVAYRQETNVAAKEGTEVVNTSYQERHKFSLTDSQVMEVAKAVEAIHNYYGSYMDIEWGVDSKGKLWILQARPETVWNKWMNDNPHTVKIENKVVPDEVAQKAKLLLSGVAGMRAATGRVVILDATKEGLELAKELNLVQQGDIMVTTMTKPDMVPAMKRAGAIVTDEGGPTCHAAIVARELKIPCIVGTSKATKVLSKAMVITVDANRGKVYDGALKITELVDNVSIAALPVTKTKIGVIVASPFLAMNMWQFSEFKSHYGVSLLRKEFADSTEILVHPLAGLAYDMYNNPKFKNEAKKRWIKENIIDNEELKTTIESTINGYPSYAEFYKDKLANTIALIAAAQVGGQRVKFRTTDFKTNEYKNQIGGSLYEPEEKNPMMGNRGIYRMLSDTYRQAFELEIEAIKKARTMQSNIDVMFPVVRTPEELKEAVELFAKNGLVRGEGGFQIGMMAEVPANVFQAQEFYKYVDFMSIGSNDMTQFVLGLGRDNDKMKPIFNEANPAVKRALEVVIKTAKKMGVISGLCGQRPSNDPNFAAFLVASGIDSIGVVPEVYKNVVNVVAEQEKNLAGQEFDSRIAGYEIPASLGHPKTISASGVDASEIIKNIGIHPEALLSYAKGELKDAKLSQEIKYRLSGRSVKQYVIDKVYEGLMREVLNTPEDQPVIYQTDDLNKSEYEALLGGKALEPFDENPQLGFTGLARVVDPAYREFLGWQIEAIKKVRQDAARSNIGIRLDLSRTLEEVNSALSILKENGLIPGQEGLMVGMEISGPANVLLINEFIQTGINFISENNERFLSYDLALDPNSSYIDYSPEIKANALDVPRKIWTTAAQKNGIAMVQFEDIGGVTAARFMADGGQPEVGSKINFRSTLATLADYTEKELKGKKVLIRVDFNVSDAQGVIKSDKRIREALPTLRYLMQNGATLVLVSHNERPAGKVVPELSMGSVAERLSELLKEDGIKVVFHKDSITEKGLAADIKVADGAINVLENTRFYAGEEKNDAAFAQGLAALADNYLYIFDAFGTAERLHASTGGAASYMNKVGIGYLMEKENKYLQDALANLSGLIIGGGPKVSEKVPVVKHVIPNIKSGGYIIIGTGPVSAFLKTLYNVEIGQKPSDQDIKDAQEIIDLAKARNVEVVLPVDFVVTDRDLSAKAEGNKSWIDLKTLPLEAKFGRLTLEQFKAGWVIDNFDQRVATKGWYVYDIGPETEKLFREKILSTEKGRAVFYNGMVGVEEMSHFASGSQVIAQALAEATQKGIITVVGGGDTTKSAEKNKIDKLVTHSSTGGGASAAVLQGKELQAIDALKLTQYSLENASKLKVGAKELSDFISADNKIYNATGKEAFEQYLNKLLLSSANNKVGALVIGAEFLKSGGAVSALDAVAQMNGAVKISIYGKNAESIKTLLGSQDIITGKTQEDVMLALGKLGVKMGDIVVVRSKQDIKTLDVAVREVVAEDLTTAAIAKAILELYRGKTIGAEESFAGFYQKIMEKNVITEQSYNESKEAMLAKLEEGTLVSLDNLKVTEQIAQATEKARLISTEFMGRL